MEFTCYFFEPKVGSMADRLDPGLALLERQGYRVQQTWSVGRRILLMLSRPVAVPGREYWSPQPEDLVPVDAPNPHGMGVKESIGLDEEAAYRTEMGKRRGAANVERSFRQPSGFRARRIALGFATD